MVLLNTIVQISTLPDANGLQITPCSVPEPVCGITGQDRLAIGLATIDHDALGPAMALKCLA